MSVERWNFNFGSPNGVHGQHSDVGLVEVSKIFKVQIAFFFRREPLYPITKFSHTICFDGPLRTSEAFSVHSEVPQCCLSVNTKVNKECVGCVYAYVGACV